MARLPNGPDDGVWRALAHPTRRAILDVLRDGPRTTGEIVAALGLGRHVVVQHLAVLRQADLVLVEPRGRRRINQLNPVPFRQIYERWVSRYAAPWAAALVALKEAVETAAEEDQAGRPAGRDVQRDERREEGRAVG
ncbi:MAG TPA: metalloregulator ArsR/SmtB family transcription factor [Chloroflexota bacterium]|nr:metalloregulator ArsR/SmtB family transcription factor [Chloroflexota bacterium]